MTTSRTKIENSPHNITIPKEMNTDPKEIEIDQLTNIAVQQEVSLTVKVVSVSQPEKVRKGDGSELTKQDIIVRDSTGHTRVVLWEKDVGVLQKDCSYKLQAMTVRSFEGIRYLYKGTNSHLQSVDDIGDVAEDETCTPTT